VRGRSWRWEAARRRLRGYRPPHRHHCCQQVLVKGTRQACAAAASSAPCLQAQAPLSPTLPLLQRLHAR
jgi:hypothetical protein